MSATGRPKITMYNQAGIAELAEPSGPFISVADAQEMSAWRVAQDRAMRDRAPSGASAVGMKVATIKGLAEQAGLVPSTHDVMPVHHYWTADERALGRFAQLVLDAGFPARSEPMKAALAACLDVLLRMIPEFSEETGIDMCTQEEHNSAIEAAAIALHGEDRSTWPPGVQKAAEGEYE